MFPFDPRPVALVGLLTATTAYLARRSYTTHAIPKPSKNLIAREAVHHVVQPPWAYTADHKTLHVKLRTKKGNLQGVEVLHKDIYHHDLAVEGSPVSMQSTGSDELFDYWACALEPLTKRCEYTFKLKNDDETLFYNEMRFHETRPTKGFFKFPILSVADVYSPPRWVRETVWYQIFPERFANGDPSINPKNVEPWGSTPTRTNFCGGDFQGIMDHIDHLVDLGITGIYFTPIFLASTNHKYDTIDYFEIDPQFGTKETFRKMVDLLHSKGIRVMLDCVFNHCGEGHPYFVDVKKNHEKSKYRDWFHVTEFPLKTEPLPNYATFAFEPLMPKLNTNNPDTRNYLLKAACYWIEEFNIDGWRLDVASEVDHKFWREFCSAARAIKSDIFILGEFWHNSMSWIGQDKFDSVMNYPITFAINDFICEKGTLTHFIHDIVNVIHWYPETTNLVLFNLISSHDTDRYMTRCKDNMSLYLISYVLIFTFPGTPCIYYGDEIGMTGEYDPGCRKCMEWDVSKQNRNIFKFMQKLVQIRKQRSALGHGTFKFLEFHEDKGYFGYQRVDDREVIVVYVNTSPKQYMISPDKLSAGKHASDLWSGETLDLKNPFLLNGLSFRILSLQ